MSEEWEREFMQGADPQEPNPHWACGTVTSPECPTGEHECSVCGKPIYRNGRKELVHCDYLSVANDHAAR